VGARETGWESLPDPRDRLTRKSILMLSKNDASVELDEGKRIRCAVSETQCCRVSINVVVIAFLPPA
jgi:hypothetical protein